MFGLMQSPNVGVGGADFGNRGVKEFCYQVEFYDENGGFLCVEPFTATASGGKWARELVDLLVEEYCEECDYAEAVIILEDVC